MSKPLVSVLAPAYQCERYLEQMAESIVHQTYESVELIIVDDGSTDRTYEVACQLARHHKNICARTIEHGGHAVAFNHALGLATGELIARQDADDWSDPSRLLKQISMMLSHPLDLVTCGMRRVYTNGKSVTCNSTGMDPRKYATSRHVQGPVSASIIAHRHLYEEVGGFAADEEGADIGAADSGWNFRVLVRCPECSWGHVQEDLYYYRDHSAQCTKRDGGVGQRVHLQNQVEFGPLVLENLDRIL